MNKIKRIFHLLFRCPTFWRIKPSFECPECGKEYRMLGGHDIYGVGVNYCEKCADSLTGEN